MPKFNACLSTRPFKMKTGGKRVKKFGGKGSKYGSGVKWK